MSYHKDARIDEVFVGNTLTKEGIPVYLRELKTVRLGEQAYDIKEEKIDLNYLRPLFVGKSEAMVYDRIMMDRLRDIMRRR